MRADLVKLSMKKWVAFIVWIGLTAIIGSLVWKTEPNIEQTKSPEPKIFQTIPTPTPVPTSNKITLAAVGDINLGREVNYQIIQRGNPNFPFEKIKNIISSADIAISNLEGPVIENCPIVRTGFRFCGQPENVQGLTFAGFDAMNLANNHINNYGLAGFKQTVRALQTNNINYFFDDKIWYKKIGQTKLAFMGFDDTVTEVNSEKLTAKIEKAKEQVDIVVVNFHWGEEYKTKPKSRQKELAKLAIDAGADLIIGHHPHVIQPLEYYKTKPVFYSLGNFVFDQMWSEATKTGAIGLITIENKKVVNAKVLKVHMVTCCQPELIR